MDLAQLSPEVVNAAKSIELLLLDCDGVLTDGRLYFSSEGEAMKSFHVHDGQGIKLWQKAGFRTGIITGRESSIARARAAELGIEFFLENVADKAAALDDLMGATELSASQIAYVGDDIADAGPMKRVGFPVAVADCVPELEELSLYKTRRSGGLGAVREVIEILLAAR